MNIVIVGGGKIGFFLAQRLNHNGHAVTIIEKDVQTSQSIAENSDILVIQGDGCDPKVLEQAGCDRTDVVAAVTGDDEDNLVISQLAKDTFKVRRTVARVNDPKNERIFNELGVDVAVDSTAIIAKIIEEEVSLDDFINLLTFKKGKYALVRVDLVETSPVINKAVREIDLPPDSALVTVIRGEEIIIPRDDLILKEKDDVIAITKIENESQMIQALLGEIE